MIVQHAKLAHYAEIRVQNFPWVLPLAVCTYLPRQIWSSLWRPFRENLPSSFFQISGVTTWTNAFTAWKQFALSVQKEDVTIRLYVGGGADSMTRKTNLLRFLFLYSKAFWFKINTIFHCWAHISATTSATWNYTCHILRTFSTFSLYVIAALYPFEQWKSLHHKCPQCPFETSLSNNICFQKLNDGKFAKSAL